MGVKNQWLELARGEKVKVSYTPPFNAKKMSLLKKISSSPNFFFKKYFFSLSHPCYDSLIAPNAQVSAYSLEIVLDCMLRQWMGP